ncbi:DNA repair protein complementing XP-A cells homolog [Watersipora subatra]|uniref:DNA repair protein complementing XP-A cells homolog n=1 Tax=Watersipora subatra TaxID=2589382 RepID=UPI00355C760D
MPKRRTRASARKEQDVLITDQSVEQDVSAAKIKSESRETIETKDNLAGESVTALQRARIENNRLKALQLRKSRKEEEEQKALATKRLKQSVAVETDTGAGFFIEDSTDDSQRDNLDFADLISSEPCIIEGDGSDVECKECCRPFSLSFLKSKFNCNICDNCHDRDKHKLITRTTAKTKYLLKDEDLDKREPLLLFITKKNPRNNYWGDMKLYLEAQCYERAMEIWGSMETIEEESTKRKILNVKAKAKRYDKKMNALKKEVRSSLYQVQLSGHTHEWGVETYNEESDEYTKQCTSCGHKMTYEVM